MVTKSDADAALRQYIRLRAKVKLCPSMFSLAHFLTRWMMGKIDGSSRPTGESGLVFSKADAPIIWDRPCNHRNRWYDASGTIISQQLTSLVPGSCSS